MSVNADRMTERRAKDAVLRQLARAHDRFAAVEQIEANANHPILAGGARWHAQMILRAWLAERDDPEPAA